MGLGPEWGLLGRRGAKTQQQEALRPGSVFLEYLRALLASPAGCIRFLPCLCGAHRASDVVLCAVKQGTLYGEGTIEGNLRHARVRMLCLISGQSLTWTPAGVKSGLAGYAGSTAREHRRYNGVRSLVWSDQGL